MNDLEVFSICLGLGAGIIVGLLIGTQVVSRPKMDYWSSEAYSLQRAYRAAIEELMKISKEMVALEEVSFNRKKELNNLIEELKECQKDSREPLKYHDAEGITRIIVESLIILGVCFIALLFLAPYIGLLLGFLLIPFVILRNLYHLYPLMTMIVVMIGVVIAVLLLARSYRHRPGKMSSFVKLFGGDRQIRGRDSYPPQDIIGLGILGPDFIFS